MEHSGGKFAHKLMEQYSAGPNPGSPAIDAGDNTTCPSLDYRGKPRPADGDGDGDPVCDMGAFELWETPEEVYLPLIMG